MKKRSFLLCILILAAILSTACGTDSGETGIEVHQVRGNAAAQGENSEVYFEMHNHGSNADQLTGISSNVAEAELHEGTQIVETVPVEAFADIEFGPEGYHVVLVGLKQELHVGVQIEIVLHFRDHEDITVPVPVRGSTEPDNEH